MQLKNSVFLSDAEYLDHLNLVTKGITARIFLRST